MTQTTQTRYRLSPGGIARTLAAMLLEWPGPATALAEDMAGGQEVRIEATPWAELDMSAKEYARVQRYGLDPSPPHPRCWHRSGRLVFAATGLAVATTDLAILPYRMPPEVLPRLAGGIPFGTLMAPYGMRREDRMAIAMAGEPEPEEIAVRSSAVLMLNGIGVAIARERFTGLFCEVVAAGGVY